MTSNVEQIQGKLKRSTNSYSNHNIKEKFEWRHFQQSSRQCRLLDGISRSKTFFQNRTVYVSANENDQISVRVMNFHKRIRISSVNSKSKAKLESYQPFSRTIRFIVAYLDLISMDPKLFCLFRSMFCRVLNRWITNYLRYKQI